MDWFKLRWDVIREVFFGGNCPALLVSLAYFLGSLISERYEDPPVYFPSEDYTVLVIFAEYIVVIFCFFLLVVGVVWVGDKLGCMGEMDEMDERWEEEK